MGERGGMTTVEVGGCMGKLELHPEVSAGEGGAILIRDPA
jgi:hypothetical protein